MANEPQFGVTVAAGYDDSRGVPEAIAAAVRDRMVAAMGISPGARLLEVGAGTGALTAPYLPDVYEYVGLDSSRDMLARFGARVAERRGIALVQADIAALPFPSGSLDAVLALRVLGVVPGWRRAVRECVRVLKPGGRLVSGRIEHGADSLHMFVRGERIRLLSELGVETRRPGADEDAVIAAVAAETAGHDRLPPVVWRTRVEPRRQIEGNLLGWRVQALPSAVQADLKLRLLALVQKRYGKVDEPVEEEAAFVLHSFRVP